MGITLGMLHDHLAEYAGIEGLSVAVPIIEAGLDDFRITFAAGASQADQAAAWAALESFVALEARVAELEQIAGV